MEPEKKEKRSYRRSKDEGKSGYIGGFFAIATIIAIFIGLKFYSAPSEKVAGVKTSTKEEVKFEEEKERAKENVKGTIDTRVEKIKKDIEDLNALDVTTESPQLKKIISDLESLQNLPKNQAKNFCEQICTNFE